MKKRDIIAAATVLAIAFLVWAVGRFTREEPKELLITVAGETYGFYSLEKNQKIEINNGNICEIKDGYVSMIQADCPDQICVHTAKISEAGGSIVCLPHKVVLEITGETDGKGKKEPEVDSISS